MFGLGSVKGADNLHSLVGAKEMFDVLVYANNILKMHVLASAHTWRELSALPLSARGVGSGHTG